MDLQDADSAEHGALSSNLLITAVVCPMPDRAPGAPSLHAAGGIRLRPGTRIRQIYGCDEISERYFCNYEVNPAYRDALEAAGLRLSGFSDNGDIRVAELPSHRFFIATLFQPQLSSAADNPHPLIDAFVSASTGQAVSRTSPE